MIISTMQPSTSIKYTLLEEGDSRWSIFLGFVFGDSRDLGGVVLMLKGKGTKTLLGIVGTVKGIG